MVSFFDKKKFPKDKLQIFLIGFISTFAIYPVYLYFKEPYFSILLSFILILYIDNFWFLLGWLFGGSFLYFVEVYDSSFASILVGVPIIEIFLKEYKKENNTLFKKIIILLTLFLIIILIFYIFIYQKITIKTIFNE